MIILLNFTCDVVHIFPENANANRHNQQNLLHETYTSGIDPLAKHSHRSFSKKCFNKQIKEVLNRNQSETDEVALDLKVKVDVFFSLSILICKID